MNLTKKDFDRLTCKFAIGDACWFWESTIATNGYGRFAFRGKVYQAHRFVFELLAGPIPEGLQLDHLCFNKACVNPKHLEPVTQQENIRRANGRRIYTRQTHCKRGHELTGRNVYLHPTRGTRTCRVCMNARSRASNVKRDDARLLKRKAMKSGD